MSGGPSFPVIAESRLAMGRKLGEGGFGAVHEAVWSDGGRRVRVAVKVRNNVSLHVWLECPYCARTFAF